MPTHGAYSTLLRIWAFATTLQVLVVNDFDGDTFCHICGVVDETEVWRFRLTQKIVVETLFF